MKYIVRVSCLIVASLILLSCKPSPTEPVTLSAPVFTPPSGTYGVNQLVTITSQSSDVEIRYTNDGNEPDANSPLYTSPQSIITMLPVATSTGVLKAKAFKDGQAPSETRSVTYSVNFINTVADPVIAPQADSISMGQQITISCITPGARIHYTLDGSDPTIFSTMYQTPISNFVEGSNTLKARAFKETWNQSRVVEKNFTVTGSQAELEIRELLDDICTCFNANDMYGLMSLVHTDYLHNGTNTYHFNSLWLDRMVTYSLLRIQVSHIDIQGTFATVYSTTSLTSYSETCTLSEPSDSGEISYFLFEDGQWWIYGNQR